MLDDDRRLAVNPSRQQATAEHKHNEQEGKEADKRGHNPWTTEGALGSVDDDHSLEIEDEGHYSTFDLQDLLGDDGEVLDGALGRGNMSGPDTHRKSSK